MIKIHKHLSSKDGVSHKFSQETEDHYFIETGYYNLDEHIICISSQIGCPIGCIFCATGSLPLTNGKTRYIRNLTNQEIEEEVGNVIRQVVLPQKDKKSILLSYMGMGEPLLNYQNVTKSIHNLARTFKKIKRATIATSGINPEAIKKLTQEKFNISVKLHLSLHAPTDTLRAKIIPHSLPIKKILSALTFFAKNTKNTVKVNYVMMQGINDSSKQAEQLANLLKPYNFIIVKLSQLNPFMKLTPSPEAKVKLFEGILNAHGIQTTRFVSDGLDIKAGCGQFSCEK